MPATCSIVLERPRCNADFQTIHALRGADPNDAAMAAWLATGNLSQAPKGWNGIYVPDSSWEQNPEFAWWYTAGQVSIATSLPENEATTAYIAHLPDAIVAHAGSLPPEFQGHVASSGSPFERLQQLQEALLKTAPVVAYPDASLAEGTKGDAQLGIFLSTLQELIDNPLALSRPESRAFGLIVVDRLQAINDSYAVGVSFSAVKSALSGAIPDVAGTDALRQSLSHALSGKWPLARREAFLLGTLTAQVAYNAAVLREPQFDAEFRGAMSGFTPYAGMSPSVHADIEALRSIPYATNGGEWSAINAAASREVTDMVATP
jgi:hypothetical protein